MGCLVLVVVACATIVIGQKRGSDPPPGDLQSSKFKGEKVVKDGILLGLDAKPTSAQTFNIDSHSMVREKLTWSGMDEKKVKAKKSVTSGRQKKKKKSNDSAKCRNSMEECRSANEEVVPSHCDRILRSLSRVQEPRIGRMSRRQANSSSSLTRPSTGNITKQKKLQSSKVAMTTGSHKKPSNVLWLSGCRLTEVPWNVTSSFKNLTLLNLDKNNISELKSESFVNNFKLKELHLLKNKITTISRQAFASLADLDVLVLGENQIRFLEVGTFASLTKLTRLDLSSNLLEAIEPRMFVGLTHLIWLQLDYNSINKLEKQSFLGLQSLRNLRLDDNPIQTIDNDVFKDVSRLRYLSLYLGNLTRITKRTFDGLSRVHTLSLGEMPPILESPNNSLQEIRNTYSNETTESHLSQAPETSITYIGRGIFSPMVKLKRISLTDYGGYFKGLWKSMFSKKHSFKDLSVFVYHVRECNCTQPWIKELTLLGAYVHGFCLGKKPLSCTNSPLTYEEDDDEDDGLFLIMNRDYEGIFEETSRSFFTRNIKGKT